MTYFTNLRKLYTNVRKSAGMAFLLKFFTIIRRTRLDKL